jgi:hypothetical protein
LENAPCAIENRLGLEYEYLGEQKAPNKTNYMENLDIPPQETYHIRNSFKFHVAAIRHREARELENEPAWRTVSASHSVSVSGLR